MIMDLEIRTQGGADWMIAPRKKAKRVALRLLI